MMTRTSVSYRFFLFDSAGRTVRLRLADCDDVERISTQARALLETEEPYICAIEAWDTTHRLCRVERPSVPVAPRPAGTR
jgi:hypothetical protein